jgi:L-ectoine synthase
VIVRQLVAMERSGSVVRGETWTSRRLLLAKDGMGFSMHDTILRAGSVTRMRYAQHVEAVYCVEGRGQLDDLNTGRMYPIEPGTLYALDRHDHHVLRAATELRMVCVFNPPLVGPETHDEDGGYPLLTQEGSDKEKKESE